MGTEVVVRLDNIKCNLAFPRRTRRFGRGPTTTLLKEKRPIASNSVRVTAINLKRVVILVLRTSTCLARVIWTVSAKTKYFIRTVLNKAATFQKKKERTKKTNKKQTTKSK